MATDGNDTYANFGKMGSVGLPFDPNNYILSSGFQLLSTDEAGMHYRYEFTNHQYPGAIILVFVASQEPILGDKVVNGVLVPRDEVPNPSRNVFQDEWPEPIINNDPGFQAKHKTIRVDVWGRGENPPT